MPEFTLNVRAYNNVTWQQIANDLCSYHNCMNGDPDFELEGETIEEKCAHLESATERLEQRIGQHQLIYFHRGYTTQATAIERFPKEIADKLKQFSKDFAKAAFNSKNELAEWEELGQVEKLSLLQKITDEFRASRKIEPAITVNPSEDEGAVSRKRMKHEEVNISDVMLHDVAINCLQTLCHELWHTSSRMEYEQYGTDLIPLKPMSKPADVLYALDGTGYAYISPESAAELREAAAYELQVSELMAVATEAYFKQAYKDLNKTGGRSRGGSKPRPKTDEAAASEA